MVDDPRSTDCGSLLHLACKLADADATRALLSAGVNPCVQNEHAKTPLQIASAPDVRAAFNQELLQAVAQSRCVLLGAKLSI